MKRLIQPQTQHSSTEAVPSEESAFLQAVVDAIPGTFYVIDERGYFVRWNRAAQELVGTPDEQMPCATVLDAIFEEDRPLIANLIQKALAKGYAEAEARVARVANGSGQMQWRFLTARRVDIAGKSYLVGTGLDVTGRNPRATTRLADEGGCLVSTDQDLVELRGLEPLTPRLPALCSPN